MKLVRFQWVALLEPTRGEKEIFVNNIPVDVSWFEYLVFGTTNTTVQFRFSFHLTDLFACHCSFIKGDVLDGVYIIRKLVSLISRRKQTLASGS